VCDQFVTKYLNAEFKEDIYFVNEVETQLREKPLWGSQTQDIYYLENKTSNKAVTLTYSDPTAPSTMFGRWLLWKTDYC
jgi:hypothetical protein